MSLILVLLAAFAAVEGLQGSEGNDLVTNVPGLNFKPTFNQYSGYLNATDGKNLFYWLVESQNDPSNDPVILWLQGGPGCSSVGFGFLTELGPFHVNPDGHTLFENVFAWNKFSNVLFLESPSGVGYSYSDNNNDTTNDDLTAHYNFEALRDFFYNKFPQYQTHDFYVAGESYGGVYVPTLAKLLIDGIAAKQFPDNFRGIAIGNGILSEKQQYNSLVNLMYFHGIVGVDDWNSILSACCSNPTVPSDECDFYSQRSGGSNCSHQLGNYMSHYWVNDHYNMYQDCYVSDSDHELGRRSFFDPKSMLLHNRKPMKARKSLPPGTQDMSHQLNYDSTDADFGFQCWADAGVYLNLPEVKTALHVAKSRMNVSWCGCCDIKYIRQYFDMADTFKYIIENSKIRILIYNGDVDLVCNFLGDQWFIERQVVPENKLQVKADRKYWNFRKQIAGYVKKFDRLDLLTMKGSGHFVPEDRAGPALQMIFNFVQNTGDYSKTTGIDVTPKQLNA